MKFFKGSYWNSYFWLETEKCVKKNEHNMRVKVKLIKPTLHILMLKDELFFAIKVVYVGDAEKCKHLLCYLQLEPVGLSSKNQIWTQMFSLLLVQIFL